MLCFLLQASPKTLNTYYYYPFSTLMMAQGCNQIIYMLSDEKPLHPKSVFLAGTTSKINVADWHETLSVSLSDMPVTILVKENHGLHAANEKQKQKHQRSKKQLPFTGGISIQEVCKLINHPNQVDEASNSAWIESEEITLQPAAHTPLQCSDCRDIGHRRL